MPAGYQRIAAEQDVPASILYALAAAESGQRLASGGYRPWPWTLNVAGTPRRFRTASAALEALRAHLDAGQTNIDIGLMQVNWHWHSHRFASPAEALAPYTNLCVGARILREQHDAATDWLQAAGLYHAPADADAAAAHRARVRDHLEVMPP